jgi:hypothetical protein
MNNIFDFATSELSQDAFICWCVNWINDDSKPALKGLSVRLLQKFAGVDKVESVKVCRQFSRDVTPDDKKIAVKIDVLLVVNRKIAVIVEDKVFSGEHDNQIQRYVEGIRYLADHAEAVDDLYGIQEIRTVFLKTGFMYDIDKTVHADVVVDATTFKGILELFKGESEILDSYIEYLDGLQRWYDEHGNYKNVQPESFWNWNIARDQIAQYKLMRYIFPEDMWDGHSSKYMVDHGSSYGQPWTEMDIFGNKYNDSEDSYYIFWRIDTDKDGPYISLRFYEDFNKKDEQRKVRHRDLYDRLSGILSHIVTENRERLNFEWDDLYPGYRGNYKESSLIHFKLKDKLREWDKSGEKVCGAIRELTELFLAHIAEIHI